MDDGIQQHSFLVGIAGEFADVLQDGVGVDIGNAFCKFFFSALGFRVIDD